MKRFAIISGAALTLAFLGVAIFGLLPSAFADDPDEPPAATQSQFWAMARGGQLYDNWASVQGVDLPEQTHPAYPADGKRKGATTWRCKECHGWDYRGADGAYGSGSHFSGVKGIRNMVGQDPAEIAKILRNDTHGYTPDMITDNGVEKLALFVSLGQVDMDLYIDRGSKKARGFAQRGASLYQTICAVCHGFDGKALNFHDAEDPEFVGTIAQDNPWEFLHKARFGQPGVPMVGLVALPMQDLVDILAYAQTLPAK